MRFIEDLVINNGRWYDQSNKEYTIELYKTHAIDSTTRGMRDLAPLYFYCDGDQKWMPSPTLADCQFNKITIY